MKTAPGVGGSAGHLYRGRAVSAGYVLAFASGATALIYEVLWVRRFISLFGATAPATSATLAAVFLGLAVGSLVVGKRCARWPRPLRAYGILEVCVGLGALLVVPLVGLYERLYPLIYNGSFDHPVVFVAVKIGLAVAALFTPAFLMGGTLPLLAQAFVPAPHKLGKVGSAVYAANTFGATVGALSVPFVLLPTLGAERSYLSAVAANLLIGAWAIYLDWRSKELSPAEARRGGAAREAAGDSSGGRPAWMLSSIAFLSGALVLALEVLWTRMLAQVHENSIYSFAIVLAVFLVGLAGGASLARALLGRGRDPAKALGLAWVGAGAFVFGVPHLFYFLTGGLSYVNEFGASENLTTLMFAVAAMLPAAVLAGTVLPLLLEITARTRGGSAGLLLGRLLAINTAGAVAGPLIATYAVLPALGLWVGIAAAGLLMIVTAELWLEGLFGRRSALARRAAVFVLLAALVFGQNPLTLPRVRVGKDGGETLVHLREGSHGIVSVVESPDDRWLLLNNFYTLGGTASAVEERQQARTPILLHPAPRSVAFVGLGTGITAGGALLPDVEKVVALELVPEVVSAAGDYFAEANLGLLKDGRVEVINEDARVYLRASGRTFDVIVGDLVVPWRSGESSLFTEEHFAAARKALAPGGIFCQWLPMYQLSEEQFKIIAATFLDVFPRATLWRGDFSPDAPALALVGHTAGDGVDAVAVDGAVQRLKPWFEQSTPILSARGGLWLFFVGPLDPADPRFAGARRNRESEPWIELLSPATGLGSRGGTSAPFVGEDLLRFMEEIRAAPGVDSPLKNLSPEHARWAASGALLWKASLLLRQGHEQKANALAAESLAPLPAELRDVIDGGPRHEPNGVAAPHTR